MSPAGSAALRRELAYIKISRTAARADRDYAKKFKAKFNEGSAPWICPAIRLSLRHAERLNEAARNVIKRRQRRGGGATCERAQRHQLFMQPVCSMRPQAANAGGVAVSGLEMTQNSMRLQWSRAELDQRLRDIMKNIHERCVRHGTVNGKVNYSKGANIAGFIKVADAMVAYGVM